VFGISKRFVTRFLGFLLIGCASEPGHMNYFSEPNLPITGRIDKAPENIQAKELGGDVLAFGRLRWIDNGQERQDYRSGWGWNVWLRYFRESSSDMGLFVVEKDGQFTWRIPQGSYVYYQVGWRDPAIGLQYLVPKVRFNVRTNANAVCLGTLIIDITTKRDLFGGHWLRNAGIQVDDDCDLLAERFQSLYKDKNLVVSKSIMEFDEHLRLPKSFEARNSLIGILRTLNPNLVGKH
jgi:hypothetical protein